MHNSCFAGTKEREGLPSMGWVAALGPGQDEAGQGGKDGEMEDGKDAW